ncbi:MAG: cyclic nucleotide-binding domain-containing protein [Sulfuricella sp.]|nr:cyclic nucleotide-binding domain-containing protein [Sulfuricella sp.]
MLDFHSQDTNVFLKNLVQQKPLFDELTLDELYLLFANANKKTFHAGEYILRENELGDSMFIVWSGRVSIMKATPDGLEVEVTYLGPYEVFGEMAIIENLVRSASVRADTDCSVMEITRNNLAQMPVGGREKLFRNLARILSARLRETNVFLSMMLAGQKDI